MGSMHLLARTATPELAWGEGLQPARLLLAYPGTTTTVPRTQAPQAWALCLCIQELPQLSALAHRRGGGGISPSL